MTDEIQYKHQIGRMWDYIKGYHAVHVVNTGTKLGLFASLKEAEAGLAPADLAAAHGLHAPYVETWCKTAAAFHFLDCEADGRYRLAPFHDAILASPGDPRNLANYCAMMVDHLHDDLAAHPEYLRSGAVYSFQDHGAEFSAGVADLTAGLQTVVCGSVLPKLPGLGARLDQPLKVLDMGCGAGGLMLRLAKAYPDFTCHGVDIDRHGIELAGRAITEAGLDDRVTAELVDGGEIGHEAEFDLVTLFEVLHELPPTVRPQVLANCAKAMKDDGRLLIIDETYPEAAEELRDPDFFFAVLTGYNEMIWGNVVPTKSEQERLLAEAGLEIEHRALLGGLFTILLAAKTS